MECCVFLIMEGGAAEEGTVLGVRWEISISLVAAALQEGKDYLPVEKVEVAQGMVVFASCWLVMYTGTKVSWCRGQAGGRGH